MASKFHPPKDSKLVRGAVNLFYPAILSLLARIERVTVEPDEWRWLEQLRDHRALILPNHPTVYEPLVVGFLSRKLGRPFNYVATHEMFQGVRGWLVQRCGAYSILRGRPDRPSLRMSRQLLADHDRKLVIFPEGETHTHNDKVIPLHPGALQIGFWGLERLEDLGKDVSLPVMPLFIKYRFTDNALPAVLRSLSRLEEQVGVQSGHSPKILERILAVAMTVLAGVEMEYGLRPTKDATPDERISRLFDFILERVAGVIHAEPSREDEIHLRMRVMSNRTHDYLQRLAEGDTPYARRLHERRVVAAQACLNDLERLQNFMAVSADYLQPPLTVERAAEILGRLEKEVLGQRRLRPRCEALVRLREPLELAEWLPRYQENRKATVAECTDLVEGRLRELSAETRDLGALI